MTRWTHREDYPGNSRRDFSPRQIAAAARGISLSELVTEAVKDKLAADAIAGKKPWLKLLGKLKHLHKETARINALIEKDSERIDPEMRVGL
jgi:hypothetical protein